MPFPFMMNPFQLQAAASKKYANLMLQIQSMQAWAQVAQQYMKMLEMEQGSVAHMLEEDDDDDDDEPSPMPTRESGYDDLERSTERMFLYAMKFYFLQAADKLNSAYEAHYQQKQMLGFIIASRHPAATSMMYLSYYNEAIRTLGTAATLQRYDALSQWLVYEIIETDDFDNSRMALPEHMLKGMAKMGYTHTSLQVQEATYGLQGMYIEYYMKAMFAAPFANNNAASSFLEEEMTAEPNKPFFSPMMFMAPQYMNTITTYLDFASATFGLQAAQLFHIGAQIGLGENTGIAGGAKPEDIKRAALQNMYQWAYLSLQSGMVQLWSFFASGGAHHTAAVNANSFVQTGAENIQA